MVQVLLLTVFLVLLGIAAFLGWLMWRHYTLHRVSALQYDGHNLVPPASTVCPQCRRRNYGRRAVDEHYCSTCDHHYN